MNERLAIPTEDIKNAQRRASAPHQSVWVEANAGSGKTHVLTQRVLRLLLDGAAPENLLCLTYTKAAAAEMRRRVADNLGAWAIMPDEKLDSTLTAIEGAPPNADKLNRARTLFGHALETPGGLKINTIHAYCESVLQRFPLEAGVPFGFSVIEDVEQSDMLRAARDTVLARGAMGEGPLAPAVQTLMATLSDHQIEQAIASAMGKGADLDAVLQAPENAISNLEKFIDLPTESAAEIDKRITSETLLTPTVLQDLIGLTKGDATKTKSPNFADLIARSASGTISSSRLLAAFFTGKGDPRKTLLLKTPREARPDLLALCEQEQLRLIGLKAAITKRNLFERSVALLEILAQIKDTYEAQKRASSRLDFDDLIAKTLSLLNTSQARDWVAYKLDAAITHILVDESQDTSPAQRALIDQLLGEFFAGEGAAQRPRTFFVVGDRKQSIYSFQGARPDMLADWRSGLEHHARQSDHAYAPESLRTSFRTLENILNAVELVCAKPDIASALLITDNNHHESARADKGGSVTLWPPVRQQELELPEGRWPLDKDVVELRNAARQLAERITGAISDWINTERELQQRGRAVQPDDVLILVQSRSPLFHEIIRALKKAGLSTPGADKLSVTGHIAVQDLLVLADVLLNPADDLGLAAMLRSPLFDLSEDELFDIAHPRQKEQTLWNALSKADAPNAQDAYKRLSQWRSRLDFERPYDLFAHILYAEGGLRRFHARLGEEVDDVLAEFLDLALAHENAIGPGLQNFLAAMRRADITIKRDLAEQGAGVRVMTVHGAKGLEAPIVILADAATGPNKTKMGEPVYALGTQPGPLLVHASSISDHSEETIALRTADVANQTAEYWRKLYVGMTRAEDELYVTGMLTKAGKLDGTWYEAIDEALRDQSAPCNIPNEGEGALVYPIQRPEPKPIDRRNQATGARTAYAAPPLPKPDQTPIIQPSRAHVHEELFDSAAQSLLTADLARKQGIALHALLQHLCTVDEAMRETVARRALEVLLPEAPERHAALAAKTISILTNPANKDLFGPQSRAEIPFIAEVQIKGKTARIAGRIDRLVTSGNSVLAVDFKSDAAPPAKPEDVPAGYLTQLALYRLAGKKLFPDHEIQAAIFWTESESLMLLSSDALDAAMDAFTFAQPLLN